MTTVTPEIGYYLVEMAGPLGLITHLVGKDKHCTCGGSAGRRCPHIRAVAEYLTNGGDRALEAEPQSLRDPRPVDATSRIPDTCPLCGETAEPLGRALWRCVEDSSHYWKWRAEQNDGAIRRFLTGPHPVKRGPFYAMSEREREAFLLRAARLMHRGGYTPHNGHNGKERSQ